MGRVVERLNTGTYEKEVDLEYVTVELTGTSPLVMHNRRLANPLDPIAKEIKKITSKRKKTEDDLLQIADLEWRGGIYSDPDLGVCVPTWNVLRSFEEAAKVTRQGRTIMRSVVMTDVNVPLQHDGPDDIDALWKDDRYRWYTDVGVQTSKLMRMRPIFPTWSCEVNAMLLTDVLDRDAFESIVAKAGLIEGIGDARKLGYGRYEAKTRDT